MKLLRVVIALLLALSSAVMLAPKAAAAEPVRDVFGFIDLAYHGCDGAKFQQWPPPEGEPPGWVRPVDYYHDGTKIEFGDLIPLNQRGEVVLEARLRPGFVADPPDQPFTRTWNNLCTFGYAGVLPPLWCSGDTPGGLKAEIVSMEVVGLNADERATVTWTLYRVGSTTIAASGSFISNGFDWGVDSRRAQKEVLRPAELSPGDYEMKFTASEEVMQRRYPIFHPVTVVDCVRADVTCSEATFTNPATNPPVEVEYNTIFEGAWDEPLLSRLPSGSSDRVPVGGKDELSWLARNAGWVPGSPSILSRPARQWIPGCPAFTAVPPTRLLDTRFGIGSSGVTSVRAGGRVDVTVLEREQIPDRNVTAVVLNVTAVNPAANGYVTVYPTGQPQPNTSALNYVQGRHVANQVVVGVGNAGRISLFSSARTDLLVDVHGFVSSEEAFTTSPPARILDTRGGLGAPEGPVAAGGQIDVKVLGRGGVPATGVSAVVANVTVVGPAESGFVAVSPKGPVRPRGSTVNFTRNLTTANGATVQVGAEGRITLYSSARAHLVVDIQGYIPSGSGVRALPPERILDTRTGIGAPKSPLPAGGHIDVTLAGRGGLPTYEISGVILNLTVNRPSTGGYLTAYPTQPDRPNTSTLNYAAGQTVANGAIIRVRTGGKIRIYSSGRTHVIVDVQGYIMKG